MTGRVIYEKSRRTSGAERISGCYTVTFASRYDEMCHEAEVIVSISFTKKSGTVCDFWLTVIILLSLL